MYKKIALDNGIPLVIDSTKDTRSICLGIWVKIGSRNEPGKKNGISHFLEHMLFKGTQKRTALDIAVEIDSLGGELNAFTSRETTTFYVRVLDEHTEKAVELITDLFLNSTFPADEIEKEKKVIFEEIKLVEDSPEDYIHDIFNKTIWGENGLGQPVLGSEKTLGTISRDILTGYVEKNYGMKDIVISCSGNLMGDLLTDSLNKGIGLLKRDSVSREITCPEFKGGINIIPKDLSEVHLCMGIRGLAQNSSDRYSMYLLNTILGGGFSSRLFQEVREKRGLAYSVFSFNVSYFDTGMWAVYAGTNKEQVDDVVKIILDQIRGLSHSVTADELLRAKNQLKGNLLLSLESTNSKMINIAKQEIYYGIYHSPEDIIRAVESVSIEDLKDLSRRLVENSPIALTVYGPVKKLAPVTA